jgi:hypothetical protein
MALGILQSILDFQNTGRAGNAIANAYQAALHGTLDATNNGQANVSNAANLGIQGVENASQTGQAGVNDAFAQGSNNLNAAGGTAINTVNNATGNANTTLQQMLGTQTEQINPYLTAGQTGLTNLQTLVGGPGFQFNYEDYKNDPAYQFQLESGSRAIQNAGAARGLGSSGSTLKELTNYGQGVASTHYQDAFNRARDSFNTNFSTGLAGNQALIGAGTTGLGQFNAAQANAGNQIAQNQVNAGKYEGDTTTNIAQLLAALGLDASKFNSQTGMTGALANSQTGLNAATTNASNALKGSALAGDYAIGAGNATAARITGQGAVVNDGISSLARMLMMMGGGGPTP